MGYKMVHSRVVIKILVLLALIDRDKLIGGRAFHNQGILFKKKCLLTYTTVLNMIHLLFVM